MKRNRVDPFCECVKKNMTVYIELYEVAALGLNAILR